MKYLLFLILTIFSLAISGQKNIPTDDVPGADLLIPASTTFINQTARGESSIAEVVKSSKGYSGELELELRETRNSRTLTHYHYDIVKDKIRIFGAAVHVAQEPNGNIKFAQAPAISGDFDNSSPVDRKYVEIAQATLKAENIDETEEVWISSGDGKFTKALRVILSGPETLYREVVMADGEMVSNRDLLKYSHQHAAGPDDTIVTVRVFDPDPLTTAQVNYGPPYIDKNDKNSSVLDVQRKQRSTIFTYKNGQFQPENDFVKIAEFSHPITSSVIKTSTTSDFNYTRDIDEFEDVNVIFHITQQCQHMAALGYPQLPGYQVQVDAHAVNGADQSFFSSQNFPYRLYFGEGGVDDAEDADVILHEFCHAVIFEAAPSFTNSPERSCIEEALCDYFAISYSRTVNNFNVDDVFNWDGHNPFWAGRKGKSGKNYTQVNFSNNFYQHTDLMVTPLLKIYDQLGRQTTDQLVLEAIFNLTSNTTMPDMAEYILRSDSMLNNGVNHNVIYDAFVESGMFSPPVSISESAAAKESILISNTYGFANGQSLRIHSEGKLARIELYDMNGRLVRDVNTYGAMEVQFSSDGLSPGFYILKARTQKGRVVTTKVSRAR